MGHLVDSSMLPACVLILLSQLTPQESPVSRYAKPPTDVLQKTLNAEQFRVTQQCGTEPPFQNAYWDHHAAGIYVDVVSGEPLFSSLDKFDSGSGWPTSPTLGARLDREGQ